MGYFIQKSGKKSWQLIWRYGRERARNIQKGSHEALRLGFHKDLTFEQARALSRRLRAEDRVKRRTRDREARAYEQQEWRAQVRSAFLTDEDAELFEQLYLEENKIRPAHWSTMQKIIVGTEIHPSEWFERKSRVYEQFLKLRCSYGYAKKLLRYLNLWGYFVCKKHMRAWLPVPGMDGNWRNRLEAARRPGGASLPLSPQMLEDKKAAMTKEHYRWLFVSVWFGLRPEEVDALNKSNEERWYITENPEFGYVLSVFQKKLYDRGVLPEDCWKHIPTVFKEQRTAIEYIKEGALVRPRGAGGKFMRTHFGPGYSHYAGRNYFSGLLREAGYDLETRKHWLGHLSIKTTEAYDRKTQRGNVFYRVPVKKTG